MFNRIFNTTRVPVQRRVGEETDSVTTNKQEQRVNKTHLLGLVHVKMI